VSVGFDVAVSEDFDSAAVVEEEVLLVTSCAVSVVGVLPCEGVSVTDEELAVPIAFPGSSATSISWRTC
jgi:hypothetical protein